MGSVEDSIEQATIIIRFIILKKGIEADVDVPLDITANELVLALSSAYQLDIDQTDIKKCYLQAENPIALLKGNKTLREYGLRNGSAVYYTDEG